MSNQTLFDLTRVTRTTSSEVYLVWRLGGGVEREGQVGHLDLHFHQEVVYGTLVLFESLEEEELNALRHQIDHQLCDPIDREDFICSVYESELIWEFSDRIKWAESQDDGATVAHIEKVQSALSKVLGRHQNIRGKLTEHAVADYFKALGYTAKRAGSELDALKVDVVADSETEVVYAQCKRGSIGGSEMRKIVLSVASFPKVPGKEVVAAIIANTFPQNSETIRRSLEREIGIPIMCVQLYQVVAASPEYRHALTDEKV